MKFDDFDELMIRVFAVSAATMAVSLAVILVGIALKVWGVIA